MSTYCQSEEGAPHEFTLNNGSQASDPATLTNTRIIPIPPLPSATKRTARISTKNRRPPATLVRLASIPTSSTSSQSSGIFLKEISTFSRFRTIHTSASAHPTPITTTSRTLSTTRSTIHTAQSIHPLNTITETALPTSSPIAISYASVSMTSVPVMPTSRNATAATDTSSPMPSITIGTILGVSGALALLFAILLILCHMRSVTKRTQANRKKYWDLLPLTANGGLTMRTTKEAEIQRLNTLNRAPWPRRARDAGPAVPVYTERRVEDRDYILPPDYTQVFGQRMS